MNENDENDQNDENVKGETATLEQIEAWRLTGREHFEAELQIRADRIAGLKRQAEENSC